MTENDMTERQRNLQELNNSLTPRQIQILKDVILNADAQGDWVVGMDGVFTMPCIQSTLEYLSKEFQSDTGNESEVTP